ncbi:hypothetical protein G3R49_19735 [Shewanella sp. WXL01]|uniref:WD40/YVTN/BNR-like repeat-containing protein n=1 Tax=Shewanella sp. WXL01 TaxID=2709721 RepID=UPI0014385172|nr:hypothetical protein [Shewanella sp. WXL01]NKF52792.1 hypothetical protein [Shewanella sp. WXL01]
MIYRTNLDAGVPNTISKQGKYFYLLTAADILTVRLRDSIHHTQDYETEMREGMSATFKSSIDEVVLKSESAQYVEFWLSDTKLDYSKLAAGGAAANVNGGTVFCPAGKSLAIPADFRRKAVSIKVSDTCQIGGLDVSTFNGFTLEPNEKIKAESRGDIWVYREPAKVIVADGVAEFPAPKEQHFDSTGNGLQYCIGDIGRLANGTLFAFRGGGRKTIATSTDEGVTWVQSTAPEWVNVVMPSDDGVLWVTTGAGQIYKSVDGVNFDHVVTVKSSVDLDGNNIDDGSYWTYSGDIGGQVLDAGHTILYANYDRAFLSINGGKSWLVTPRCDAKQCRGVRLSADRKSIYLLYSSGQFYIFDTTNPSSGWVLSENGSASGAFFFPSNTAIIGDIIVRVGGNISSTRYVKASVDGGKTFSTVKTGSTPEMRGVNLALAVGASVILLGSNGVGVITDVTQSFDINWYDSGVALTEPTATFPSAGFYDSSDNTIKVFQGTNSGSPLTAILSYPVSITEGYLDGVTVSWLAEIN